MIDAYDTLVVNQIIRIGTAILVSFAVSQLSKILKELKNLNERAGLIELAISDHAKLDEIRFLAIERELYPRKRDLP